MSDVTPPEPVDPAPVSVQNTAPIPVEVQNDEPLRVRTEQDKVAATRVSSSDKALAGAKVEADAVRATARVDADILRTEDQRRISGIWERTQQVIALSVVVPTIFVASVLSVAAVLSPASSGETRALGLTAFTLLATLTGSVIGFYFGRTNHQRVGGETTPTEEARGR